MFGGREFLYVRAIKRGQVLLEAYPLIARAQGAHYHTAHHTLAFPIPSLSSHLPPLAVLLLPPPPPPAWLRAAPTSPSRSPPAASARGSPRPRRSAGSSRRLVRTRRPAATTRSARASSSARGFRSGSWAVSVFLPRDLACLMLASFPMEKW